MSWYSRRYQDTDFPSPLTLDHKIVIYEDQVYGWFLDIAKDLEENVATDFVTLMIVTSFFEGHAIFLKGQDSKGQEKELFEVGFRAVLDPYFAEINQPIKPVVDMIWERVRCGLFHVGMTLAESGLYRGEHERKHPPIWVYHDQDGELLIVNAPELRTLVEDYFRGYIARLQDETELRQNFEIGWDVRHRTDKVRKKLIVELLKNSSGPMKKREIADEIHMSKRGVSPLLAELVNEGVLEESEVQETTGKTKYFRLLNSLH
jgi:predicted transcriptional regulator